MLKILIISTLLWTIKASNILGIFPTPDINHFMLGSHLMETLAKKGHQVTMVTPFTPEKHNDNLTVIEIRQELDLETVNKFTSSFIDEIDINFISSTIKLYRTTYEYTEALLSDRNFQDLLQSHQKYDVIIAEYFMNEALLGLSSYFNAPLILLSPYPSSSLMSEIFANPVPSAYVPNILTGHSSTMNFADRLHNLFCNIFNKYFQYFVALPRQERLLKKYISNEHTIRDVMDDVSLVLLNSHSSVTEPVPHTPNMIEIGGIHITSPKPLPEDLEHFVSKSSGVVYFSLNSDLKTSNLGKDKVNDILKGFQKLKDLRVIWNVEEDEDIEHVPKNVMIVTDVSHQDILGQDNVVAFITDGNLIRILEAVYYKKPIIGIPLIYDQKSNIARVVQDKYGIEIPFNELSGDKLYQGIQDLLKNGEYSYSLAKRSNLLKDQVVSPLDTAIHWIEFVIKHGDSKLLQSAGLHLSPYKRHLIDIIIVLAIIDIILFFIFYYIFKHIIHLIKRKYKDRKTKKYVQLEK